MAESETVVGNAALGKLGQSPVLSFDDADDKARWLKARFASVRDVVLRSYCWTFAGKRAQLSADLTAPAFDYSLRYLLPDDCLRLIQINGAEWVPGAEDYVGRFLPTYQLEGRYILTDVVAPLNIRYTARIDQASEWDALFDEALACRLAFDLAEKLTQSSGKKEAALRDYQLAIREAVRVNAIEQATEEAPNGSWVTARL